MLLYGTFINLQNFGIDQNYVQRFKSAKDLKSARFSALFGGMLYLPVSALFFFIGTGLFAFYTANAHLLPTDMPADKVFPYFIIHELPVGVTGLLIAAVFAAGMSTVSTSINSSATVVLSDFFRRKSKPESAASDMKSLYLISLILGVLGMFVALAMMSVKSALDAWWSLAGIFSGGMLGLFLMGYLSRAPKSIHAMLAVGVGLVLIAWLSFSGQSIFHTYLTIVFGTLSIVIVGFVLSFIFVKKNAK